MYIKVKVTPGAREESIFKQGDGGYKISVREKAERNLANNRVRALLAENLNIPQNRIRLISGHLSRSKIFSIID